MLNLILKEENVCDYCNSELIIRKDNAQTVKVDLMHITHKLHH